MGRSGYRDYFALYISYNPLSTTVAVTKKHISENRAPRVDTLDRIIKVRTHYLPCQILCFHNTAEVVHLICFCKYKSKLNEILFSLTLQ